VVLMALSDLITKALSGVSRTTLEGEARGGSAPMRIGADFNPAQIPGLMGTDKGVHALAAKKVAERFGPGVAETAGLGKEILDELRDNIGYLAGMGLGEGADYQDLVANRMGINAAAAPPAPRPQPLGPQDDQQGILGMIGSLFK
jgi:hypothetical protein